ncbi:MAG TPA: hypothetical protein VFI31_01620 [Pirellulales bacterium]|nr:hypothetical protein [Pirellulales bacterium]
MLPAIGRRGQWPPATLLRRVHPGGKHDPSAYQVTRSTEASSGGARAGGPSAFSQSIIARRAQGPYVAGRARRRARLLQPRKRRDLKSGTEVECSQDELLKVERDVGKNDANTAAGLPVLAAWKPSREQVGPSAGKIADVKPTATQKGSKAKKMG